MVSLQFYCQTTTDFEILHYSKVLAEKNDQNSESIYFQIYVLVLGVYAAVRISFAFLVKFPAIHSLSEKSDPWSFFQFFKWIYEVDIIIF